jgi:hypothetical protein
VRKISGAFVEIKDDNTKTKQLKLFMNVCFKPIIKLKEIMKNIIRLIFLIALCIMSNSIVAQIIDDSPKDTIVNSFERSALIELDSVLQITHRDTLKATELKLNGLWHYQGIRKSSIMLADTFLWSSEGTFFVKEGKVFQLHNEIEKETADINVTWFDFKSEIHAIHVVVDKEHNGETYDFSSCQPSYTVVFYNNQIGVLASGMGGYFFDPIKYLDNKILILEVERTWGFEYINNEYSTIHVRKDLEYFIRKE